MATLEYVSIPPAATRLDSAALASDIRPAKRVFTSLPSPSQVDPSSTSTLSSSTSSTLSLLPQLLLSGSIPPGSLPSSQDLTSKDRTGKTKLLTTRDALSLPITSTNFRRFVARAGPIFWLQDRVEEIVMWRRGWKVTGVWMAAYAFLCYFPRLILLLPNIALIGIILASYPYQEELSSPTIPSDSNVNWQANLQAIQNLMGFVADTHDLIHPHTRHLFLSPSHFPFHPLASHPPNVRSPSSFPSPHTHVRPLSPYPPYILTLLLLTLPPLIFILSSPFFPLRTVCLILGVIPLACTHPTIRPFYPYLGPILESAADYTVRVLVRVNRRIETLKDKHVNSWLSRWALGTSSQSGLDINAVDGGIKPLRTILERIMDDDRLNDRCWRAEMREVELWENERFVGGTISSSTADAHTPTDDDDTQTRPRPRTDSGADASPTTSPTRMRFTHVISAHPALQTHTHTSVGAASGWSKSNLRPGERGPWTRGRDGRGGVGAEVSNLTFSLAPGWAFVPSESWRKDRAAEWAFPESKPYSDMDGWVYTNDVWGDARAEPYNSADGGGGSLTRRRRWVRRVWFDGSAAGGRMVW